MNYKVADAGNIVVADRAVDIADAVGDMEAVADAAHSVHAANVAAAVDTVDVAEVVKAAKVAVAAWVNRSWATWWRRMSAEMGAFDTSWVDCAE